MTLPSKDEIAAFELEKGEMDNSMENLFIRSESRDSSFQEDSREDQPIRIDNLRNRTPKHLRAEHG